MVNARLNMPSEYPDVIAPTPERLRRGVELIDQAIADDEGRPSQPYRSIDILASLERRRAITGTMRLAGERFRNDFHTAQLEPLMAADMARPMVSGKRRSPLLSYKVEDARESVWFTLVAVGGLASLGGSCLWCVIGRERPLGEWAIEQGWRGYSITLQAAPGILIATLDRLENYYDKNG